MIKTEIIEQVKRVPIPVYLQSKGIIPAAKHDGKNAYSYCSPLSNERSASFFVSRDELTFNDYSTAEKGDVIRLVRLLERLDFVSAVTLLQRFVGSDAIQFDTTANGLLSTATDQTIITGIYALNNADLLKYIEQKRGIPYSYATPYVRQIHYTRPDKKTGKSKKFFGVGFKTDVGSWAIRTDGFKGWIGQATITTLRVPNSNCINLFEGFFSFLSACVYFGRAKLNNTTIVLNSVSHLSRALPALKEAHTVFCFLDNDRAGRESLQRLRSEGVNVVDRSTIYRDHPDFNDYLTTR